MNKLEDKMQNRYKRESDELLFEKLEFDGRLKNKVRQAVRMSGGSEDSAAKKKQAPFRMKWAYGTAAAVMLLVIAAAAIPMLSGGGDSPGALNPGSDSSLVEPAPGQDGIAGGGPAGSELSQLTTVVVQTAEEAKQRFGGDLVSPSFVPEGYSLSKIETTGIDAEVATRAIFFYESGSGEYTYMADREEAFIPVDMFEPIQVGGADGYIFVQPGMTELLWIDGGIQYALAGPLSQEEALAIAGSLE